ncbi:MAG: Dabb family protein [Verrucomicrobiia bacterium]
MIIHSVYFQLKPSATSRDIGRMRSALEGLSRIPGVQLLGVGTPADVPPRAVLCTDYTLALVLSTDSVESLQTYQEHPIHREFLQDFKDLWETVRVFDLTTE